MRCEGEGRSIDLHCRGDDDLLISLHKAQGIQADDYMAFNLTSAISYILLGFEHLTSK